MKSRHELTAARSDQRRSPFRVLVVCARGIYGHGGVERAMQYLVKAWDDGPEVPQYKIIDPRGPGHLIWSPVYFVVAIVRITFAWITKNVDIVHVNMAAHGSIVRKIPIVLLGSILRIPVILHCHGAEFAVSFSGLSRLSKTLLRFGMSRSSKIIALGDRWKEFMCDEIAIDPGQIVVMRNAVRVPVSISEYQAGRPCRLLFLGLIGTRKGVPELLDALASERVRALDWIAVLAGSGEVEKYRRRADQLGLGGQINFSGWVAPDEVSCLLRENDVLVLPSHNEGLPMAILEGMANALVVITTPVGAIPEVIADHDNGILVPAGNVEELSMALSEVITDAELRVDLGRRARQYARAESDINVYAQRMLDLYRNVLGRNSTPY